MTATARTEAADAIHAMRPCPIRTTDDAAIDRALARAEANLRGEVTPHEWRDAVRLRIVELGARLLGDECLVLPCEGAAPDVVFSLELGPGGAPVVLLDGEQLSAARVAEWLARPGPVGLWLRELHQVSARAVPSL